MQNLLLSFYRLLLALSGAAMLAALGAIVLNILSRIFLWTIPGLDGYAGYAIAATLFLALPSALRHGDHIQATLVLHRFHGRVRHMLEGVILAVGTVLSLYLAWFACRLVWTSYTFHDVAPTGDATPMWIPQLAMALGCVGFAVAFVHAAVAHVTGGEFFVPSSEEALHAD